MMHTLLDTSEESERIDGGASGCLKGKAPLKDMTRMIKGLKNRSTGDEQVMGFNRENVRNIMHLYLLVCDRTLECRN